MHGLTFQGSLDNFWGNSQEGKPDNNLLQYFQGYLVQYTQLNGSLYKCLHGHISATGFSWNTKHNLIDVRRSPGWQSQNKADGTVQVYA
jgi:hypothetical protein